mgnify:CR=1 FL=1|nr:MAG TPA: helix-turn-helix domain protein [Caudoviricetes sp.]
MSNLRTQYSMKELRARINKTQSEVASDIGVSTTTYNYWENNIGKISISKCVMLAEYFGVNIEELKIN